MDLDPEPEESGKATKIHHAYSQMLASWRLNVLDFELIILIIFACKYRTRRLKFGVTNRSARVLVGWVWAANCRKAGGHSAKMRKDFGAATSASAWHYSDIWKSDEQCRVSIPQASLPWKFWMIDIVWRCFDIMSWISRIVKWNLHLLAVGEDVVKVEHVSLFLCRRKVGPDGSL